MSHRILYIEDNPANRVLVRRILQADGFEVLEADNALDGIDLAQQTHPDLILMDLSMPELDGLSATEKLRTMSTLDRVPIIALTAHVMKGDESRALEVCDGYIPKPIDVDRFPQQVLDYLRKGR